MSLDGLANFDWDNSDNDDENAENNLVTEEIPVTKTSPDDATPTGTANTPETDCFSKKITAKKLGELFFDF